MTSIQKVQYRERGQRDNFTAEKPDKHDFYQMIKITT